MPGRLASKTFGTVSADRQKEMSGLEFVQGLVDGTLPLNTIAQTLGYDVTEAVEGASSSPRSLRPPTSIQPARCTVASPRRCSTVAWD